MAQKKPWFMSKTVWAAVIVGVLGVLDAVGVPVPQEIYAILGALGLYGLRTAKVPV